MIVMTFASFRSIIRTTRKLLYKDCLIVAVSKTIIINYKFDYVLFPCQLNRKNYNIFINLEIAA